MQGLGALQCDEALALLLALWPLCATRRRLQDAVVMVLRKLMFSQELRHR